MKKWILAVCCALPLSLVQAGNTVRAVVDEWAPFGGQDLPNRGISLDVMDAVLTRAGYQMDAEIVPWERALSGTQNGSYDVIGNLFPGPETAEFLYFSDPIYETEVKFVQRRGGGA
ncbi:MAG: transporter substrate-binding domain-containing protein, partial [Pseudomonadota bacterium]